MTLQIYTRVYLHSHIEHIARHQQGLLSLSSLESHCAMICEHFLWLSVSVRMKMSQTRQINKGLPVCMLESHARIQS